MNDPTTSIYTRNARRQIQHAVSTGKEHDLYGAIYQLIGHSCHLATIKDHRHIAFYCDPQGILTFDLQLSRSQREGFNDPDYAPSISSNSNNGTRRRNDGGKAIDEDGGDALAAEGGRGTTVEAEEEEEEEEESTSGADHGIRLRSRHVDPVASSTSTGAITTSSVSTMFTQNITRYPDYRLVKAYLDHLDNERVRYELALVEVKIFTPSADDDREWKERRSDINSIARKMLPQVIQAVQVMFAKNASYQEVVAIPVVNEFCKFMYFHRSQVPPFDPTKFDPRGFQLEQPHNLEGDELAKELEKFAYKVSPSQQMIKMIYGVHENNGKVGFGEPFLRHWGEFVSWTNGKDKFDGSVLFPERPGDL